ncbi:PrgI family protein [Candidatus Uhrbacteria bacterium]|nr:MAG: PrgI family protein [Candidatus Uhrbacteria bacterium]
MPEKFVVPQFIDNEDKILGPITVRQFLICLGATLFIFIAYRLLTLPYFIFATVIISAFAGTFAFLKINGQPFHLFFVNFLQTQTRPNKRVWNKDLDNAQLKALIAKPPEAPKPVTARKSRPESTRLRDLALTVNTGGVYNPEEDVGA